MVTEDLSLYGDITHVHIQNHSYEKLWSILSNAADTYELICLLSSFYSVANTTTLQSGMLPTLVT